MPARARTPPIWAAKAVISRREKRPAGVRAARAAAGAGPVRRARRKGPI